MRILFGDLDWTGSSEGCFGFAFLDRWFGYLGEHMVEHLVGRLDEHLSKRLVKHLAGSLVRDMTGHLLGDMAGHLSENLVGHLVELVLQIVCFG